MQYGEIITLGKHRLMCGDATSREDVMRLIGNDTVTLVLTDPPYGYKVQKKNGTIGGCKHFIQLRQKVYLESRKYPVMQGDNSTDSARKNYEIVKELTSRLIFWGGQCFADFLPPNPAWLFWDKNTGANDFSDGELAWCSFGKRIRKYKQTWNGVCKEATRSTAEKRRRVFIRHRSP